MKSKPIITRIVAAALRCLTLAGSLAGCQSGGGQSQVPGASASVSSIASTSEAPFTRPELETWLAEMKKRYEQNPQDPDTALRYSQALFTLGDFDEALEALSPCLNTDDPSPDAMYLAAQIEYMKGNYREAEKQYQTLKEKYAGDFGMAADYGLQMVYYQTNEYHRAANLFAGEDFENPLLDLMRSFGETKPYQPNWNGKEQTTIPFLTTDPLPVIPVEINGVRTNAFLDTGGAMLAIEKTFAEQELGITSGIKTEGEGAGGSAEIKFGATDSLKLGDVDIHNVPVILLPFDGFKNAFEGYAAGVTAIIGVNVFQQFIPTIDYLNGQLILRPRDETGRKQLSAAQANESVAGKVPFALADTHYMFSKGSINGYSGLNMFVDSGLNDVEHGIGFELSKETMDMLGIPMPEMRPVGEGNGGLGGDDSEYGIFDVDSYGLGDLQSEGGVGTYDTSDPLGLFMDEFGFFADVLISHNYLKQYKWTLDYDAMTMTFSK